MAGPEMELDVAALQRDIHGYRVVSARLCDYCGGTLDIDGPVLYEVARFTDELSVTNTFQLPDRWAPDAARCENCTVTTIDPATDGVDEVLLRVGLTESADLLRLDATEIDIIAHAPPAEGYYPPLLDPNLVLAAPDVGLTRWLRIQYILANDRGESDLVARLRTIVSLSPEVPPGLS